MIPSLNFIAVEKQKEETGFTQIGERKKWVTHVRLCALTACGKQM